MPLIQTCHAMPLPCSDSAVSFVKVRVVAGNIRTASQTVLTGRLFCSLLLQHFTVVGMDCCKEDWYASDNSLCGTLHGSWKKPNVGRQPACRLLTAVLCRGLEKNGMVRARHGQSTAWSEHGMGVAQTWHGSVNQTWPHCVNQMGKTHSKPLAARHAMCESALTEVIVSHLPPIYSLWCC